MRRSLALIVLACVSVSIAKADEKPTPPPRDYSYYVAQREARRAKAAQAALEKDSRLAKLTNSPPQQIGLFAYYPNKGGGYTFVQGKDIVFYALPYAPSTYKCEVHVAVCRPMAGGGTEMVAVPMSMNVLTIGPSTVPFGGQTV